MYSICGLTVSSELELPGLPSADGKPDVVIRCGPVPEALEAASAKGVSFQAARGRLLLQLDGVARYSVVDGRIVTVDPADRAAPEDIRTILLGTVLSALLYQRGLIPFHASAVRITAGAVLLGGRSGAGKSTLAAVLALRGYEVLADDVAAVTTAADGAAVVIPGPPQLWLWKDALVRLDIPSESLGRVRPGLDKHVWPTEPRRSPDPVPVVAYYQLQRHNQPTIELAPAHGMDRVRLLSGEVYRAAVGNALADQRTLFGVTTALSQDAHVVVLSRPNRLSLLDELADQVLADLERSLHPMASGT